MSFEKPWPVKDLDVIFPANVDGLIPKMEEIPKEFKDNNHNKWVGFQQQWFFKGLKRASITAKEGIDLNTAIRHLQVLQGSFELKHEHKEAGVAYLASLWFSDWKEEEKR